MFWSCPLSANTQEYYVKEGQTSFDPVVFFKLMLIGYLDNIPSDSKIVEQAGMRLDMLYFFTIIKGKSNPSCHGCSGFAFHKYFPCDWRRGKYLWKQTPGQRI